MIRNTNGVEEESAGTCRVACDDGQKLENRQLMCRVKFKNLCKEEGASYSPTNCRERAILIRSVREDEFAGNNCACLRGLMTEYIYHLNKGTKLSEVPENLDIEALKCNDIGEIKFEAVLNESDVTVWVILMFPEGLTCELVFWKEGHSTESLANRILGIEYVDYPFFSRDEDMFWVWAGLYDKTETQVAEGGIRIRNRTFSEEMVKREAESVTGVLAAPSSNPGEVLNSACLGMPEPPMSIAVEQVEPVSNPVVAVEITHSDKSEPVTLKAPPMVFQDEDSEGQASSVSATVGLQECPSDKTKPRPPLVVIEPHKLGGKLVVVNGVCSYPYRITRDRCLQIIEILQSGEAAKLDNPKSKFQHRGKGDDGADHETFAKRHLVSNRKGWWRIVADKA